MSETNSGITPPTITRNGVSLTLTEAVFSPKSKDHKGKTFFVPELEMPALEYRAKADGSQEAILTNVNSLLWMGVDQVVGACDKVLRGVFGGIASDIYEDPKNNGEWNMDQFMEEAPDFQAARQSLAEIADELDDLQALQMKYAFDPVFQSALATGVFSEEAKALQKKVMEISTKAGQLRTKRDQIEAEGKRRAAVRKENEAKREAAKKGQLQPA